MNVIWRRAAAALIVILALAASLLVPATASAQSAPNPGRDCTIHIFHGWFGCEAVQVERVNEMLAALHLYAADTGTFRVDGGGFRGGGTGWAYWEQADSPYPTSIATVLINEGYLSPDSAPDAALPWSSDNDVMVYQCQDRVAVFATGIDGEASSFSRDWWADNDCTTYPIDRLDATFFSVSVPLSLTGSLNAEAEQMRVEAVSDMVAALESYGAANGTYRVDGSGFRGGGTGWTFWEDAGSATYPVAIATVLANEGHLPADAARDPLWSSSAAIEGDLMTYRCKDRVAVFTRHAFAVPYGPTETSAFDSGWWADNGCTRYPIDRLNATYFELSAPLP